MVGATYSILQSAWGTITEEANAQESCDNGRRRTNKSYAGWKTTWRASSTNWIWRGVLGEAVPHRRIGRSSRVEADSHGNQTRSKVLSSLFQKHQTPLGGLASRQDSFDLLWSHFIAQLDGAESKAFLNNLERRCILMLHFFFFLNQPWSDCFLAPKVGLSQDSSSFSVQYLRINKLASSSYFPLLD